MLPFVVLPVNSELFEFNKMLFIYAIAVLIGGVWLLRSFQAGKFIFRKTPFDIPLGIFFLSQVVSTLFSIDQHTSFFGYYGRFNGGLLSTFTYLFLYYGFVSTIDTHKNTVIRRIFSISIISSILVVLWGLPGKFNHDLSCLLFTSKFDNSCWTAQFRPAERMFSTLGQPNWLGAYLAITFFISTYYVLSSEKKKSMWLGVIGVVFSYLGILLSRSRSSLMSLAPGVMIIMTLVSFFAIKRNNFFTALKKQALFILVGSLIIITCIAQTGIPQIDSIISLSFLRNNPAVQQKISPLQNKSSSLQVVGPVTESLDIRKIVWAGAWELGKQYPLFGTGVETFGYAYYSVRPIAHNATSEWDYLYNKAHNEFLNMLATTGWFGLGSYLLLIVYSAIYAIKKGVKNIFYFFILAIHISLYITNFFGFSITVVNIYWFLTLAFLAVYDEPDTLNNHLTKASFAQIGIVFVAVFWPLNLIGTYWIADYNYAQSDIALKSNNSGVAVNLLQKALLLREEHVYEDKLSYALAQYAYLAAHEKNKEQSKQFIDLAEKLNLKSIQSSSQNVLYWKTRVKNQFIFYQMSLDKKYLFTGLAALDEAYKLAPTDPKIPYFAASYYSLLYDDEKDLKQKKLYMNKSLEEINRTITLKSDYGEAYYLKAQLLRKYGMKEAAKSLLEWYIPRYAPDNEQIKKELEQL